MEGEEEKGGGGEGERAGGKGGMKWKLGEALPDLRWPTTRAGHNNFNSQSECLIPLGVEGAFDGFGLLLALALGVRNQFQFHIRV